ncbi:peptidase, M16 family, putative [Oceaniovalibus guishaninsula JLT2003]|uniref:Peptidase, M16 family, putative n=1 Tax=Oceaniovalibus guishaninsula JLT2003 TaxID=1231392 RepID=K2GL12_9RHOB|nr:pitrilysin family protein [Oceaniovalibus guishaninsula]EKE43461.1 peptidase, M16 family, putative [Oceaniovalibus guishaninsula JLT2003]
MIRFVLATGLAALVAVPVSAAVEIQEVTSPGGITAWLVEEHSIPFVALEVRFRGGTSLDRAGKRGAVNLMTHTIEEGAGDLDAQGFARAKEELAASFDFDASADSVRVSAQFLTENRPQAVELLRAALVEPRFDGDAVARVRDQVLSGIARDATDPGTIARDTFDAMAFAGHSYATPGDGTLESVAALTREDVVQAHADALVRDRLYVGAVGDITPDDLGALLDEVFGGLPQSGPPLPDEARFAADPGVTVVPFETPQSVILFGQEGIARDDDDFFAAYVTNEIFGGRGFNSRLMDEVRVKRGLTYGIGTYLSNRDHADLLIGQASTENSRVGDAVDVIQGEWTRIGDGVTQEELDAAKTYLIGAYPLRFDGNSTIAGILVGMQMDDLPIDYIETRNDRIAAVTLDDVARVAERIYRPEDLTFVIVGQPERVTQAN